MKFGDKFREYLHGEQEKFIDKFSHVEYKRLKKVLKSCKSNCQCVTTTPSSPSIDDDDDDNAHPNAVCHCQSCSLCDEIFFTELMKEAWDIAGCFSSRVRHLLHLHVAKGTQRYVLQLRQCFKNDQHLMVEQGKMLIEYITMNATAIAKILKKYDKVHCSENGKNFKLKMRAGHIELLQLPWVIELGAFYLNITQSQNGESSKSCGRFSCDLNSEQPVITLEIPQANRKLEYSLTCAICLDSLFNPYALSCGHLFCKACACSAASVMIFQGLKTATRTAKCPVCREAGVYANSVHMLELDMLVKRRCNEYWKERLMAERAEMVKQSKEYWELQTKYAIGF